MIHFWMDYFHLSESQVMHHYWNVAAVRYSIGMIDRHCCSTVLGERSGLECFLMVLMQHEHWMSVRCVCSSLICSRRDGEGVLLVILIFARACFLHWMLLPEKRLYIFTCFKLLECRFCSELWLTQGSLLMDTEKINTIIPAVFLKNIWDDRENSGGQDVCLSDRNTFYPKLNDLNTRTTFHPPTPHAPPRLAQQHRPQLTYPTSLLWFCIFKEDVAE